ncbi:hypothetical protein [Pseudomonas sp. 5P_5.1_Bac1]|uniref:hypothetical protein n=1 Tax=Pseudomonas sp. 5P_5.1_Bac1 TaxID=2971616 RepID=UPI0021C9D691|nr:hypothetical protein [Pseudomonas sp. 5P_5.1_Bac1]MCU1724503.1 hypothetical protein [Pseudomonas sp. 5P_5.1_Bac1]
MSVSMVVLENRYDLAEKQFNDLKSCGLVSGEFEGKAWQYNSKNIPFTSLDPLHRWFQDQPSLPNVIGKLARCFIVKEILMQPSATLIIGRMASIRHLSSIMDSQNVEWSNITRKVFDSTVDSFKKNFSKATTYNRSNALKAFLNFLNQLKITINGVQLRFLDRFIKWEPGIPNPIHSALELTSEDFKKREENLYVSDLHKGIAQARWIIKNSPNLEPNQGFDRIRLESLCFGMALGLRVGEIANLPANCLIQDCDTHTTFVRVPVEKNLIPSAVPVADLWSAPIKEAYEYLLECCQGARDRALDIESNGFSFIEKALAIHRNIHPLDPGTLDQISSLGLPVEQHYLLEEISECFPISKKELCRGGRFYNCSVELPRVTAARFSVWIDERILKWDWSNYLNEFKKNCYSVSVLDIGIHTNSSKASISKSKWFIDQLRIFLKGMVQRGLFKAGNKPSDTQLLDIKREWKRIREVMLSKRGVGAGVPSLVIDIRLFKRALEKKYRFHLQRHFEEQFTMPDDGEDAPYHAKYTSKGYPSKLSDNLIVVWENQFNSVSEQGIIPRPLFRADLYNYLSANSAKSTVFQRLDLRRQDGEIFSISPHQIRRWVTTAILRAGPSETAVDLWMGRTPRQSRQYDYRTAKERAEYVRSLYLTDDPPADFLGKLVIRWREESIADDLIEEMIIEKLSILNLTPWGGCSRELYVSPCDKGLMCIRGFGTDAGCKSFHLNPDDLEAKAAIDSLLSEYERIFKVIFNNVADITSNIRSELDNTQAFDQHVLFVTDMIASCKAALEVYLKIKKAPL